MKLICKAESYTNPYKHVHLGSSLIVSIWQNTSCKSPYSRANDLHSCTILAMFRASNPNRIWLVTPNIHATTVSMDTFCLESEYGTTQGPLLRKTTNEFFLLADGLVSSSTVNPQQQGRSFQFQHDFSVSCIQSMCYLQQEDLIKWLALMSCHLSLSSSLTDIFG